MNRVKDKEVLRVNVTIERAEDPLVFQLIHGLAKGHRRTAKLKRMLHVAALLEHGAVLQHAHLPTPISAQQGAPQIPAGQSIIEAGDLKDFFGNES